MKKILAILMSMTLALSLAACGSSTAKETAETKAETKAAETKAEAAKETEAVALSDNCADPGNDDTVYIGIVKYLSGDSQFVGQYAKESADLAAEQINAAGGILGKKLEIVYIEEGDGSVDQTVNAMSFALEDERLSGMVFGHSSQNCAAAAEILDAAETPIPVLWGGSGAVLAKNGAHEYGWQTRVIDGMDRDQTVGMMYREYGISNPCIFYSETTSAQAGAESYKSLLEAVGAPVSDNMFIGHVNNETNFAPYATTIMASNPDCIVINGQESDLVLKMIALKEAGLDTNKVVCMGSGALTAASCIENAGEACVGWYASTDWCTTVDTEKSQAFYKAFVDKYGYDPCNTNAVVYDQVYLFKEAMEQAGTTIDREAIANALNNIKDLDMVTGVFTSDNTHHTFLTTSYWVRIGEDLKVQCLDTLKFEINL